MAQRLHLGCGRRYIPGFVHVDRVKFPHVDHVRDIRDLTIFPDRSAELIYACQVIEYFDREEVLAVLQEWKRVLTPGGILRLSVPNFDFVTRMYAAGFQLDWFLGTLYGRIDDGNGGYIYHRTTYDQASLARVLETVGFESPRLWRWQEVEHRDIDDFSQAYFPHLEKDRGILANLNMEASRPVI
jgi:predicted SAM-dependent methyltransferase